MNAKAFLNKMPLGLALPLMSGLFYLSVLVYVVVSPLIFIYGLLLCPMVWIEWGRRGKNVLVIEADSKHSREWMARVLPLVGDRAVVLDYSQRERWDRWSVPAQLFEIFGPQAIPERFRKYSLPAVIVFRKLRRPRKFTFGERSKDRQEKLEQLRSELALD